MAILFACHAGMTACHADVTGAADRSLCFLSQVFADDGNPHKRAERHACVSYDSCDYDVSSAFRRCLHCMSLIYQAE